ncbi:hypothetical protein [uncultured Dialister sp.]|uniref:hypothetical protein n=1 Tax=uncultured Dialister sp. TaxID=278064 RepID=UPI002639AFD0|nr:hypothetical protein [uncultured Dialister sp.]
MILFSAYLVVLSIAFLASNRLHEKERLLQKLSYYIGGYGGFIYFSWTLWLSINGMEIDIISMLLVISIVYLCVLNRVKYNFKIKYENVKKHDEQSKDVQKYYNLIRFASYGQVVIFIGFLMILLVILLGVYNGRISLLL